MGGVGVLDVAWRPVNHLISIQFSLFSYLMMILMMMIMMMVMDGGGGEDVHLQVMIGGALASPPAPDPPSSFRLEISWKNFVKVFVGL